MNVYRWLNWFFYHLLVWYLQVRADALSTNQKKYCGKYLTEALSAVCEGNYQTMRPVRKSYWSSQSQYNDSPFRSKRDGGTAGKRRRKRGGVYNECCQKPCSQDQLMQYCGAPR